MIPIDRVVKHQDLTDTRLKFEDMSVNELQYYYNRFKKLKNNVHMLNVLSDKGEKVKHQCDVIEKLIVKKCRIQVKTEELNDVDRLLSEFKYLNVQKDASTAPNKQKIYEHINEFEKENVKRQESEKEKLEKRFQRIISKIEDENARIELLEDLRSAENMDKINEKAKQQPNEENYFLLQKQEQTNSEENKPPLRAAKKKDLNEIKKRIVEKYRVKEETTKAKPIPLTESLLLVQEQTKRLHELQIQQAAQKLLQGSQLSSFEYANLDRITDKARYRVRHEEEIEDFNESDHDEDNADSDFENFGKNYETYNAKKLSLFKKLANEQKASKNELDSDDDEELDKVD